jgi:hypothetical protein
VSGADLVTLLAWVGVAVVGVFLAAWARYFIVRNGAEEEVARLRVPIAATVVLVVLLVVLAVAQPPAAT